MNDIHDINNDFDSPSELEGRPSFKSNGTKSLPQNEIDLSILERLRNGDYQAFDKIYTRYVKQLKDFLYAMLQNEEEAKEITQEVFLKVWENRQKIDPQKNIKGFIYTFAKFYALNYFDKKKVRESYAKMAVHSTPSGEYAVDQIVMGKELSLVIALVLNKMPAQQKRIFEMSRYESKSNDEISVELGLSKRTVENHLYNALRMLKDTIAMFLLFILS